MFNSGSRYLKYFSRLGIYKNSTNTVSLDLNKGLGRSYRWTFLGKINGILIYNHYNWSPTTNRHQYAVTRILDEKYIEYVSIDLGSTDLSLGFIPKQAIRDYFEKMVNLEIDIELSIRVDTRTHTGRVQDLVSMRQQFDNLVTKLPKLKLSQKDIKEIRAKVFENRTNELMKKACDKCYKSLMMDAANNELGKVEL